MKFPYGQSFCVLLVGLITILSCSRESSSTNISGNEQFQAITPDADCVETYQNDDTAYEIGNVSITFQEGVNAQEAQTILEDYGLSGTIDQQDDGVRGEISCTEGAEIQVSCMLWTVSGIFSASPVYDLDSRAPQPARNSPSID